MFEAAHARLDSMIGRAAQRLNAERDKGFSDEEVLEALIDEFCDEAQKQPRGAGATHMAMSIYRMVAQQEQIQCLTEQLEMAHQGLELMFRLSDDKDEE